jgi:hypothetical protein
MESDPGRLTGWGRNGSRQLASGPSLFGRPRRTCTYAEVGSIQYILEAIDGRPGASVRYVISPLAGIGAPGTVLSVGLVGMYGCVLAIRLAIRST